jgi:hypothetical protein
MVTMDRNTWENAHAGPGHDLRRFKQMGADGRRVSVVACSCGARVVDAYTGPWIQPAAIAWLSAAFLVVVGLLAGLGWWAWRAWR